MMLRTFTINGLVALSIAAAPIAAPAVHAKDNIDRLLMGLVAVGIAGAIAHEVNDNKKRKRTTTHRQPAYDPHTDEYVKKKRRAHNNRHRHGDIVHQHTNHGGHYHKRKQGRDYEGRSRTHTHHYTQKPRKCLRQKWTNQGWVKFYSKRCLRQHGY